MNISDEIVEKGRRAATGGSQYLREVGSAEVRNILEAVAPMLIAEILREVAKHANELEARRILARAQELDPK